MIEQTIKELTEAIQKLTEKLDGSTPSSESKQRAKPKAKSKIATQKPSNSEDTDTVVDFNAVQKALIDVAKTMGKDAAKGILGEFDAAKIGDLDESQYQGVIALSEKALKAAA